MSKTVGTFCTEVLEERIGLSAPSNFVGASGLSALILGATKRAAADMIKKHQWQILKKSASFTTLAADDQITILTEFPDYNRLIDGTVFNSTQKLDLVPIDDRAWRAVKAIGDSPYEYRYRVFGGVFQILNCATAGDTVEFDYVSNYWLRTAADSSVGIATPADDDDTIIIDTEILTLGAIAFFRQARGLEYGQDMDNYQSALMEAAGQDKPSRTLNLSRGMHSSLPQGFVPDRDFPTS